MIKNSFPLMLWTLLLLTACGSSMATATPTIKLIPTETASVIITPAPPSPFPINTSTPDIILTDIASPIAKATSIPPTLFPSQSNGDSIQPRISADGQQIVFLSTASLTNDDTGRAFSVFIHDRIAKTTTLVNAGFNEYTPQESVRGVTLSANGRFVAYYSREGDLVAGDEMDCGDAERPSSCEDLFIYDRNTHLTERVPLGRGDGLGGEYTLALSADGRYLAYGSTIYDRETGLSETIPTIDGQPPNSDTLAPQFGENGDLAFVSRASNFVAGDENGFFDLFVWQRPSGTITRISDGNGDSGMNSTGEGYRGEMGIAANGRFITYASIASNLTNDVIMMCDTYQGYSRPCYNIYLHDRETGETTLITKRGDSDSTDPSLSADGRFLTFTSSATTLTDDIVRCDSPIAAGCRQLYLHDTQSGQTTIISRAPDGEIGNGASDQAVISANGRFIAYTSQADNLVADDSNNANDIFLYDRESGQTERISLPYDGIPSEPLPNLDTADLLETLILKEINFDSILLQQMRTTPYGYRYTNHGYCEYGPYRWLDDEHLMIFPLVGYSNWYDNPTGGQVAQPVVISLNGDTWLSGSPTDGCAVPLWSAALGRIIEAGDGEVRLRDLDGVVTAVYAGDYPLSLAPSGLRLLTDSSWIDLENGEVIPFPDADNARVNFSRPTWTADERRFFSCCFNYGDVTNGVFWQNNDPIADLYTTGICVGAEFTGVASYWIGGETSVLIPPAEISFHHHSSDTAVIPLIDPVTHSYEDVRMRLEIPDTVLDCFPALSPDGTHLWVSCTMLEDEFHVVAYPESYLVSLPEWEITLIEGDLQFMRWAADGRYLVYNQLDATETGSGTTWMMDSNGNHWQIADEAAKIVEWYPSLPIAALRFADGKRLQLIHAENRASRELTLEHRISGIAWQQNPKRTNMAIWDENGRIWQLYTPLNPNSVPIPLTPPLPNLHSVRWSPNDDSLAFISGTNLYIGRFNR